MNRYEGGRRYEALSNSSACRTVAIVLFRLTCAATGAQADDIVKRGDELFRGGQFAEAEGTYAKALVAIGRTIRRSCDWVRSPCLEIACRG